jgi:transposase
MAFIRIERKKSGNYIRLVESYRSEGKVRHRVIASLGKESDYTPEMLQNMGKRLYELGGGDIQKLLLGDFFHEIGCYNYGFVQAVNKGLKHYDLERILTSISRRHRLQFDLISTIKLLLCERLCDPVSKRSSYVNQNDYLGLKPVDLQHIYRSLDYLAQHQEAFQTQIFQTDRDLFTQRLDVVFYDVTTFYFDSQRIEEESLRQIGFSKDGKVGKTQVVLGLLIDRQKRPIGYELYAGNQYEGHTLTDALARLQKKYQIQDVIIVADRGMLNKDNLQAIQTAKYGFIVGERLKNFPKKIQTELLNLENYQAQWTYAKNGETILLRYHTIDYQGRKIIATYSEKRAKKDKADREVRLQKARKLLQNPSQISTKVGRFFIKKQGKQSYLLDEEKIAQSQKYDGFIAISTNKQTLENQEILDQYRHLFQIEHVFRTFKTHLEVRPMFHWNNRRIQGHFCLCYIAYAIEQFLLSKLQHQKEGFSENQLRKVLQKMQVSLLQQDQNQLFLRGAYAENTPFVIQKLNLSQIPNLIPKNKIISYL